MSYSLALGPFHPAWRGPQRFVFKLDGERVADIEYTDGFNERGCAGRLARLALPQALHLVTRICGTCSFAHSLAFCQALEQLCAITVSAGWFDHVQYLRTPAGRENTPTLSFLANIVAWLGSLVGLLIMGVMSLAYDERSAGRHSSAGSDEIRAP